MATNDEQSHLLGSHLTQYDMNILMTRKIEKIRNILKQSVSLLLHLPSVVNNDTCMQRKTSITN